MWGVVDGLEEEGEGLLGEVKESFPVVGREVSIVSGSLSNWKQ